MKCAIDIQSYNSILQEERVYTFLDGLDDRLDHVQSDVLRLQPFPSIEQAYTVTSLKPEVLCLPLTTRQPTKIPVIVAQPDITSIASL